jgi:hypothetical protein
MMNITPREVNERYRLLSKPFSSYCKNNFIDHNFVVDQILQLSLPYSEGNKIHDRSLIQSREESSAINDANSQSNFSIMNVNDNSKPQTSYQLQQSLGASMPMQIGNSLTQNINMVFKDQQVTNTFSNSQDLMKNTKMEIKQNDGITPPDSNIIFF